MANAVEITIEDLRTSTIITSGKLKDGEVKNILGYRILCHSSKAEPERNVEINNMYHHLWTKAVGTEGYDKKKWQEFGKILLENGFVV